MSRPPRPPAAPPPAGPRTVLPFPARPSPPGHQAPPLPHPALEGPVTGPRSPGSHLSTLTLHQLRYGELDPAEEPRVRAHLDQCARCRERLAEQQALRAEFERRGPPIDFAALLAAEGATAEDAAAEDAAAEDTAPPLSVAPPVVDAPHPSADRGRRRSWTRWAPVPVLLAAVALLAVRILPGAGTDTPDTPDPVVETTRLKGAAEVQVLVEGQGLLDEGEVVQPGDRIQLRVPAGAGAEAWVGDGEELIGRFPLSADRPTLSPFALAIDGEPGDEELVVVITRDPLDRSRAAAAMRGGDRMDGVEVRRIPLPKAP